MTGRNGPETTSEGTRETTIPEGAEAAQRRKPTRRGGGAPGTRGRTSISDGVVEKIAAVAARDVPGVYALGSARTLGAVRDRVPGGSKAATRGVKVEVGEVQTAIDLEIIVEYGVNIAEVAHAVRENVIAAIERMTGLEVVEVNVSVVDVKLPEDEAEEQESRLQ
nr:Asp23/Gls24 family envelope stress response protein [Streptomyces sp. TP-A0356]